MQLVRPTLLALLSDVSHSGIYFQLLSSMVSAGVGIKPSVYIHTPGPPFTNTIYSLYGVLSNSSLENGTQVKTTFNSYWACVLTGSGQWFTVARKHFPTASISVSTREWSLVGRCNGTFPTSSTSVSTREWSLVDLCQESISRPHTLPFQQEVVVRGPLQENISRAYPLSP